MALHRQLTLVEADIVFKNQPLQSYQHETTFLLVNLHCKFLAGWQGMVTQGFFLLN